MDATTTEVFAKAATATGWKQTNLGLLIQISHGPYWYTVQLPSGDRALIIGREGIGGSEYDITYATWPQTIEITEAAMATIRVL